MSIISKVFITYVLMLSLYLCTTVGQDLYAEGRVLATVLMSLVDIGIICIWTDMLMKW